MSRSMKHPLNAWRELEAPQLDPSHDTFNRVFDRLAPQTLVGRFSPWLTSAGCHSRQRWKQLLTGDCK